MKKVIQLLILIGFLCLISKSVFGQISEGGTPISFFSDTKTQDIPILKMPPVDVKTLLQEDETARKDNEQIPFRFGHAINADIDIKRDGVQQQLPNGDKLWLLKIYSSDAFSINFIFNRFRPCSA